MRIFFALAFSLLLLSGCRRTDVREFAVELPDFTAAEQAKISEALSKYDGVKADSLVFDLTKHTLTLKYDSMKIARENIRQAIEAKGIKVVYPKVVGGYAGYVDEKDKR